MSINKLKYNFYKEKIISNINNYFTNNFNYTLFTILLFISIGLIIYYNILDNTYHFDDYIFIHKYAFKDYSFINQLFEGFKFRILTMLSFMTTYNIVGDNPRVYYLHNIIFHIITTIIVWRFILLTLSINLSYNNKYYGYTKYIAVLCALIFLVNPIQTSAVSYIYQRLSIFAALFYINTILFWVKARISKKNILRNLYFAISLISMILSLFSKENTFTIPIIIILYELVFLYKDKKKTMTTLLILLFLSVLSLVLFHSIYDLRIVFQAHTDHRGDIINSYTYLISQFRIVLKYIQLILFPLNQNLDYDFYVLKTFWDIKVILPLLSHITIIVIALLLYKRNKLFLFGIMWFYITLMIESSIIPIQDLCFEHRVYLPSVGLIISVISIIFIEIPKKYYRIIFYLCPIMILIFSTLTILRNNVWQNEYTMWSDVINKSPEKPRAYLNRGTYFARNNEHEKAILDYNIVVKKCPGYIHVYKNRAISAIALNNKSLAYHDYSVMIHYLNNDYSNYKDRANLLLNMGDYKNAINDYISAIRLNKNDASLYTNIAFAYFKLNLYNVSINYYNQAVKFNYTPEVLLDRGTSFLMNKQLDDALDDYNNAIKLKSNYYQAYKNRALLYTYKNDIKNAIKDLTIALSINSFDYFILYQRAELFIRIKDYKNAKNDLLLFIKQVPNHSDAIAKLKEINELM